MAGIGLINLDLDAKGVEPIAILALAGVAGWFLFRALGERRDGASVNVVTPLYQGASADTVYHLASGNQPTFNLQSATQKAESGGQVSYSAPGGGTPASASGTLGGAVANSV
jgi:hypothetical protein